MKKTNRLTLIFGAIQAVAALGILGAIQFWAPVCSGMLTLENGNTTHMKCFFSGQAGTALAVVLVVAAVAVMLSPKDHKKVQLVNAVGAVMELLLFTTLIGVCANPEMSCNVTAVWVKVLSAVILVCAVGDWITGKEGQIPD